MYHPRILRIALFVIVLLPLPLHANDWKFDVVTLKNGERYEGLLLEETKDAVRFKYVVRKPGVRTNAFETSFGKEEIKGIVRLSDGERGELRQRLELLDPNGDKEKARMQNLALKPMAWPGGGDGLTCESKYFVLTSNAHDEVVRQVIVKLEDVFQAYVDRLGTKHQPQHAIRVTLYRTPIEYQQRLMGMGANILNPAYYDASANEIVAASDIERWSDDLEGLRKKHDRLLQELDQQEKKLRKHFSGQPAAATLTPMLAQIQQSRRALNQVNAENEATFTELTRPLFTTLYHEAFHAYLENFAYPGSATTVPRWLNEGLAQVFESALVDTGELRVGHVDVKRLTAVQNAVRQKGLVPLAELLASTPKQFNVAHRAEARSADRFFMASWALAYYLTFEKKLLQTSAMDEYLGALQRDASPVDAFRDLMGQPLDRFEADWTDFLLQLRPNGTRKMPTK